MNGITESKPQSIREELFVLIGLSLYVAFQIFVAFSFEGTYDAGDSVMHFQFARYAPQHPENLFDHWAKPFFTLLAMPFAQAGFVGIKLFQCLVALFTAGLGYLAAKEIGLKRPWLAVVLTLCATEYILAQFSGLTEPLFGMLLLASAFLQFRKHHLSAAILLSLLPFVRTEGFGILGIYAMMFLVNRQWKFIPWLFTGSILYGLAGLGVHEGNPLWIFTENPYGGAELDNYGRGTWTHYFEQYTFVAGVPIAILTWVGLVVEIAKWLPGNRLRELLKRGSVNHPDWIWTVIFPFTAYFMLHVALWATGKGHSLGMSRVMIAVVPLGALLALQGVNTIAGFFGRIPKVEFAFTGGLTAYVLLFPILPNPASLKIPGDFEFSPDQELLRNGHQALEEMGLADHRPVYASHPSWAYLAGIDPFEKQGFRKLSEVTGAVPEGAVLVWDSWFSPMEDGVSEAYWNEFPERFELVWQGRAQHNRAESVVKFYKSKAGLPSLE